MRRKLWIRPLWLTLAVGYLVTWVLGVPAVVGEVTTERLRDAAWLVRSEGATERTAEGYPWFKVELVVPIAPGLVLISHGGEAGPLAGYGQWAIYLWYGLGVRVLVERETWVS